MSTEEIIAEHTYEWDSATKFLVLVNFYHDDISWRKRLVFPYVVYSKEMPHREPYNAINQAKSETNLLKFIYDFYDRLPENLINVHQYEYKFSHQGSIVDILNDADFEKKYKNSQTSGFWNFCSYKLGFLDLQADRMVASGWWTDCMQPYFGKIEDYHDFTLDKNGCAQFVVSRQRILSLPREFYKDMYDWLVKYSTGPPRGEGGYDEPRSNFYTSRYLEWTWELMFSVVKKHENLSISIAKDVTLQASYGAGSYLIDVSATVVDLMLCEFKDALFISKGLKFEQIFGDPVCNTPKFLHIIVCKQGQKKEWLIPEEHSNRTLQF